MIRSHSEVVRSYYHYLPSIAAIITTKYGEIEDAMAAAWHSPVSFNPPLYGVSISPKRYTHEIILKSEQFGVNFLPFDKAELIARTGGCSGRDVSKFDRFKIGKENPIRADVPILKGSYAAYECELFAHEVFGDHEWFVGRVVVVHIDPEAFDERGILKLSECRPTLYLGMDRYVTFREHEEKLLSRRNLAGE